MSILLHPLIDRVERLLVRHQELQRTNELLSRQVAQITQERDALKGRLQTARHRIDALLERLPEETSDSTRDETS
jgi:cell division protein ZapB